MGQVKKPRVRRAKGTGGICRDRRRGGYRGKLPVGRKPNGKLKYDYFRAATAAEVQTLMNARRPPSSDVLLGDWSKRWLESLDVREQSRDSYRTNLDRRIIPLLGHVPVAKLTTFAIDEAVRTWSKQVGVTTVRQTLGTLSAVLSGAVRAEIITRNPARFARRPRPQPKPPDPFTLDEWRAILDAALRNPRYHVIALCAATGCRKGEALGSVPRDYDPATGMWSITRTVTRGRRGRPRGLGPPKSRRSIRAIHVPPEARIVFARAFDTDNPGTLVTRWKALLRSLDIRYRGIHALRHSVATHLLAAGVPVADVARYLGDAVDVLVRTYVHPAGTDMGTAISRLLVRDTGAAKSGNRTKQGGKRKSD